MLILSTTLSLLASSLGSEGDSTRTLPFKLSGSADAYYRYNLQNPREAPYNNYTSFTNTHNSFELGMISAKAEHTIGKVGLVADLGFGRRAEEFSYNDSNTRFAIKQLFITYSPSAKIKLTAGSWATHIGYESVDPYLNRNYSMSYMFSYGPFFHTGVKADFTLGEKTALMVGIANPTDLKSASGLPKMAIAQLATGTKDDKIKAYLNYQGGNPNDSLRLHQVDAVVTFAASSKFSLSYNGTVQTRQSKSESSWSSTNTWWGSALYANLDPTSWFGLTLRSEYVGDKKSVIGFDGGVFETTLSSNIRVDNLTIIPEFRLDSGNRDPRLFVNRGGVNKKSTQSLLVAAVYKF
jgi:hypothetical protein